MAKPSQTNMDPYFNGVSHQTILGEMAVLFKPDLRIKEYTYPVETKMETKKLHMFISRLRGFTIIELMLTLMIVAILASVAYASYQSLIEKTKISTAIADISKIEVELERLITRNGTLPLNLAAVTIQTDPWGNPYQFLNFSTVMGNGGKRKDKNLVPLNTDYDLYSRGADGQSVGPLTAAKSKDDIIRANNGGYVGTAEDY